MKSEIGIEKECIKFLIGDILNMSRFKVGFEKVYCETDEEISKVLKFNDFLARIRNISSDGRTPKKVIEILREFYLIEEETEIKINSILGYNIEELQNMIKYYKEKDIDKLITERLDKAKVKEAIYLSLNQGNAEQKIEFMLKELGLE